MKKMTKIMLKINDNNYIIKYKSKDFQKVCLKLWKVFRFYDIEIPNRRIKDMFKLYNNTAERLNWKKETINKLRDDIKEIKVSLGVK